MKENEEFIKRGVFSGGSTSQREKWGNMYLCEG